LEVTEITYLLNHPNNIQPHHVKGLEQTLEKFPYFQGARALYLKALYNQESYKYNFELKKTAAFTQDREVLFDFITSDEFTIIDKDMYLKKVQALYEIEVEYTEISFQQKLKTDVPPIAFGITDDTFREEVTETAERLELGKPIHFEANEKHSFAEWLQLSSLKKIERMDTEIPSIDFELAAIPEDKKEDSKFLLIDQFLQANPKITPKKEDLEIPKSILQPKDTSHFTTETLAKIYLEQKKYDKAIQAYEILILKYPEKSVFFADRIKDIQFLKQNNL
jgi:tetratricopeptide (TPR) repeat protein